MGGLTVCVRGASGKNRGSRSQHAGVRWVWGPRGVAQKSGDDEGGEELEESRRWLLCVHFVVFTTDDLYDHWVVLLLTRQRRCCSVQMFLFVVLVFPAQNIFFFDFSF